MLTGTLAGGQLRLAQFVECVDRRDMGVCVWQEVATDDPKEIIALGLPPTACGFRVYTRVAGTVAAAGRTVEVGSNERVEEGPMYRICEVVSISYMEGLLVRANAGEQIAIRDVMRRAAVPGARILKTGRRYDVVTDPGVVPIDQVGNLVTAVLTEPPQP